VNDENYLKLSQDSQHFIKRFHECTKRLSVQHEHGYGDNIQDAEERYNSARDELINHVLGLEQSLGDLRSQPQREYCQRTGGRHCE